MGLIEDILVVIGVLPLERPVKNNRQEGHLYINKVEQLEKLNGQYVWITDFHNGVVAGDLVYNSCMGDKYILNNCSRDSRPKLLNVHDLNNIFFD